MIKSPTAVRAKTATRNRKTIQVNGSWKLCRWKLCHLLKAAEDKQPQLHRQLMRHTETRTSTEKHTFHCCEQLCWSWTQHWQVVKWQSASLMFPAGLPEHHQQQQQQQQQQWRRLAWGCWWVPVCKEAHSSLCHHHHCRHHQSTALSDWSWTRSCSAVVDRPSSLRWSQLQPKFKTTDWYKKTSYCNRLRVHRSSQLWEKILRFGSHCNDTRIWWPISAQHRDNDTDKFGGLYGAAFIVDQPKLNGGTVHISKVCRICRLRLSQDQLNITRSSLNVHYSVRHKHLKGVSIRFSWWRLVLQKLEWHGYLAMKKFWQYVLSSLFDTISTGMWRMMRQTDDWRTVR